MPRYPYDQMTDQITLPPNLEKEIGDLVRGGNKIQAMRQVMDLTGAGLKVAKDYVDQFETPRHTPWLK
jgi:hypothetical protein